MFLQSPAKTPLIFLQSPADDLRLQGLLGRTHRPGRSAGIVPWFLSPFSQFLFGSFRTLRFEKLQWVPLVVTSKTQWFSPKKQNWSCEGGAHFVVESANLCCSARGSSQGPEVLNLSELGIWYSSVLIGSMAFGVVVIHSESFIC